MRPSENRNTFFRRPSCFPNQPKPPSAENACAARAAHPTRTAELRAESSVGCVAQPRTRSPRYRGRLKTAKAAANPRSLPAPARGRVRGGFGCLSGICRRSGKAALRPPPSPALPRAGAGEGARVCGCFCGFQTASVSRERVRGCATHPTEDSARQFGSSGRVCRPSGARVLCGRRLWLIRKT
ncbi:Uncharacterised protein [Kingella potus]|uniref:Uncharacterized protein n=1 Tax=Kingella potus TaxID=265175 RepID=A0A377R7B2_9NEIS|nr:Uncharacterised protein [Kingella potus]